MDDFNSSNYFRWDYQRGYIVTYQSGSKDVCDSWATLPAQSIWPIWVQGLFILALLFYLFVGIAIVSNIFMASIEMITSKKRLVKRWDPDSQTVTRTSVLIWNETVANLTLMALGSSAPEIMLATVESFMHLGEPPKGDGLGIFTIIGSAAFNLLIISAVCIFVVGNDAKRIKEVSVFCLTAAWSMMAYVWLLFTLKWNSPRTITVIEAFATLALFPLLVFTAYVVDNGWVFALRMNGSNKPRRKSTDSNFSNNNRLNVAQRRTFFNFSPHSLRPQKAQETTLPPSIPDKKPLDSSTPEAEDKDERLIHYYEKLKDITKELDSNNSIDTLLFETFFKGVYQLKISQTESTSNLVEFILSPHVKVQPNENSVKVYVLAFAMDMSKNGKSNSTDSYSSDSAYCSPQISPADTTSKKLKEAQLKFQENEKITVRCQTRNGSALSKIHYNPIDIELVFNKANSIVSFDVELTGVKSIEPLDFFIMLSNPSNGCSIDHSNITNVTILPKDLGFSIDEYCNDCYLEGSIVQFERGSYFLDNSQSEKEITIKVVRTLGLDFRMQVGYYTEEGNAENAPTTDSKEYHGCCGLVKFEANEEYRDIKIKVNSEERMLVILTNPSKGCHIGENAVAIIDQGSKDRTTIDMESTVTSHIVQVLHKEQEQNEWVQQIKRSFNVVEDLGEDPTCIDYMAHLLSFNWKVLFAFLPPTSYLGGWMTFCTSLFMIGVLTFFVEELGNLFGCVVGLRNAVTGVTIIALGTSLPDTFASRTAALSDSHADASIGNITGSNSVNVFLGLGLPWVVSSVYAHFTDTEYIVLTNNLELSVISFLCVGTCCIIVLLLRRKIIGGELGGPLVTRFCSSAFLILLWCSYIFICILRAHEYI